MKSGPNGTYLSPLTVIPAGDPVTFYAKEAILEHLDDIEDKYLAINRLENPGKRWSLDDVKQDSELDR